MTGRETGTDLDGATLAAANMFLDIALAADLDRSISDPSRTATRLASEAAQSLVVIRKVDRAVIVDPAHLLAGATAVIVTLLDRLAALEGAADVIDQVATTRALLAPGPATDQPVDHEEG